MDENNKQQSNHPAIHIYNEFLKERFGESYMINEAHPELTMESPPEPSIIPNEGAEHNLRNRAFEAFSRAMMLSVYKSMFGWRRFFYKFYWKVKLGFKNEIPGPYSASRTALHLYWKNMAISKDEKSKEES